MYRSIIPYAHPSLPLPPQYFSTATNVDACVYMMLANELIRKVYPDAITCAEDVSGMPAIGRPVVEGGLGFDYRLGEGFGERDIG